MEWEKEFGREAENKVITIGASLLAKRNEKLKIWVQHRFLKNW